MIEINLLPGSVKRTKRRAVGLSAGPLSKLKLPAMNRVLASAIGMWVVGVLLIVWMYFSASGQLTAAQDQQAALQRDTAMLSAQIAMSKQLMGKRDTIFQKLNVVQELDAGRFMWAHILDEISRAVPDYMWLVSILPSADNTSAVPGFRIEGRMGNAFALPKFIQDLEASPFISNVTLRGSGTVLVDQKSVYSFNIEASYETPPPDLIQTVPLFSADLEADSALAPAGATPAPPAAGKPPAPATQGSPAAAAPAKKTGKE